MKIPLPPYTHNFKRASTINLWWWWTKIRILEFIFQIEFMEWIKALDYYYANKNGIYKMCNRITIIFTEDIRNIQIIWELKDFEALWKESISPPFNKILLVRLFERCFMKRINKSPLNEILLVRLFERCFLKRINKSPLNEILLVRLFERCFLNLSKIT